MDFLHRVGISLTCFPFPSLPFSPWLQGGPVVKKAVSRVDKQLRRFADLRRMTKTGHAVKISVQGNGMPL